MHPQAQSDETHPEKGQGNESEEPRGFAQEQDKQEPSVDAHALKDALSSDTASQFSMNAEDKRRLTAEVPEQNICECENLMRSVPVGTFILSPNLDYESLTNRRIETLYT